LHAEIVERSSQWPDGGTGLYLPGNAYRALEALGLNEAVSARYFVIEQQRFLDQRGRMLFKVPLQDFWGTHCVGMLRSTLHELLRADGVPVRFGTTIDALSVDKPAHVTFNDGSTGKYDLVVGADGIHSSVRGLVFGCSVPRFVGQLSWRFLIRGFPEITSWSVMLGRGKAFLTVPLGGGLIYCYADINATEQGDSTTRELVRLRALFADFADPVDRILERLEAVPNIYFSPIEEVSQRPWVKDSTVLIGDAAHATTPNMAQGVAMALEDALLLAELLSTGQPLEESLEAFESRRTSRVDWVRQQTHRRDRTRSLPAMVRSIVLRAAGTRIYESHYRPLLEGP
jgi:FAD-dependent urate hydroxylase